MGFIQETPPDIVDFSDGEFPRVAGRVLHVRLLPLLAQWAGTG